MCVCVLKSPVLCTIISFMYVSQVRIPKYSKLFCGFVHFDVDCLSLSLNYGLYNLHEIFNMCESERSN